MRRTPLQQVGDRIGMFAYLAAMGGLQLWPRIRRLTVEEHPLPAPEEPAAATVETHEKTVAQEHEFGRERTPVVQ